MWEGIGVRSESTTWMRLRERGRCVVEGEVVVDEGRGSVCHHDQHPFAAAVQGAMQRNAVLAARQELTGSGLTFDTERDARGVGE